MKFLLLCLLTYQIGLKAEANLPLEKIVNAYLENSQELKIAKSNILKIKNEIKETKSGLYPSISFSTSVGNSKSFSTFFTTSAQNFASTSIDLSQPIYNGGSLWYSLKLANIQEELSELNYKLVEQQLTLAFLKQLYEYKNLLQKIEINKETLQGQEKALAVAKKKARIGNVRKYELASSYADYYSQKTRLQSAILRKKTIEQSLINLTGINISNFEWNIPEQNFVKIPKSFPAYMQNVELRISELNQKNIKTLNRIEMSKHYPSINLSASKGLQNTLYSKLGDDGSNTHSIALTASIPIFSGLSSVHEKKIHTEKEFQASETYSKTSRDLSIRFQQLMTQMNEQQLIINDLESWKEQSKKAYQQAQSSYRIGKITSLQLLQLQQAYEAANGSYIDTKMDYELSKLDLKFILGQDL